MSEYRKLKTKFTSRTHLRAALRAAGIPFEEARPGQPELALYGYQVDERPERATFVVRRAQIGRLSNDLGYHWNGRCFEAIVSEYDSGIQRCTDIRHAVKREYAVAATIGQARAKGYRVQRHNQADGSVQLVVTGRI